VNTSRRFFFVRTAVSLAAVVALSACGERAAELTLPLRIALSPQAGTAAVDEAIRQMQAKVRDHADVARLERLAALFVGKARCSGDPGFYKQAEACADAMPAENGGTHAAALLRGHVRHALHDFPAAERIARELASERGLFLDHGLLGDVLLDLGRLDEARASYQRMMDLRPGLQSYARAAQLRWLAGDLAASRELLELASGAGSRRDPESMAWVCCRRATLELQANDAATAARFADEALALVPDYPAARLARGRAALALGDAKRALPELASACASYPLPEHLWAHADALRLADTEAEAAKVEAQLQRCGATEDPRTFALWLATTGRDPARALQLAEAELRLRQDPLTLDVVALARLRCGDVAGAEAAMRQALACGLQDARLFVHAALIADAAGDREGAMRHRAAANARAAALLPSERHVLQAQVRGS
jgi:tetratricopeptide (TPR) repeat protein